MPITLSTIVKKHPFATFVLLAYAFSWWPWPFYLAELSPAVIVGFGPFLAAVAVLALTGGRAAVRELLARMVRWRVGWRWYAVALGLPIIIGGLAALLIILSGAPSPDAAQLAQWRLLPSLLLTYLFIPGIAGTWEEPGWRGFALPSLAARHSQLAAALLLGIIWAGWHLPLFLTNIIPGADLLYIAGSTVLFGWLYYHADSSVLIVLIFHAMNNSAGLYFPALFSRAYAEQFALLQSAVCLSIAALLIVWQWRFWSAQPGAPLHPISSTGMYNNVSPTRELRASASSSNISAVSSSGSKAGWMHSGSNIRSRRR